MTTAVTEAESWLLDFLRMDFAPVDERAGWAHASLPSLLLARGRLFTPAAWPGGGGPPGEPGGCFIESVSWAWAAPRGTLAYVEGCALTRPIPEPHAWCAAVAGTGSAIDLTWRRPGLAYLGLPVDAEYAVRMMKETAGPLLHDSSGRISALAREWMRHGVPAGVLVDTGGRLPG
ncbi:hypothetical protein OG912_37910 (plasmid) [Streptomyces sp. NBC_00464]|uniref:hypothetical protein n=1 Tax=Streptomyces sp. NBC_00464 TaxID=2975751 RepID=UPI002E18E477